MEYGGNRSTDTMYCCGFWPEPTRDKTLVVDDIPLSLIEDEKFRLFDTRLHPKHAKPQRGSDTVQATLRGRIFAKHEGIAGTQQHPEWRVTATWDAVCYSLSHKSFRLIRQSDLPIKRQKSSQATTVPIACQSR